MQELRTQKRHAKRGAYTKERKKKFDFLKHTGRIQDYIFVKQTGMSKKKYIQKKINEAIEKSNKKISFWQKVVRRLRGLFLWQSKSLAR